MCGTSNQHKLEGFLQAIFDYQEVGASSVGFTHPGCSSKLDLESKVASSTVLVAPQHSVWGLGAVIGEISDNTHCCVHAIV